MQVKRSGISAAKKNAQVRGGQKVRPKKEMSTTGFAEKARHHRRENNEVWSQERRKLIDQVQILWSQTATPEQNVLRTGRPATHAERNIRLSSVCLARKKSTLIQELRGIEVQMRVAWKWKPSRWANESEAMVYEYSVHAIRRRTIQNSIRTSTWHRRHVLCHQP